MENRRVDRGARTPSDEAAATAAADANLSDENDVSETGTATTETTVRFQPALSAR